MALLAMAFTFNTVTPGPNDYVRLLIFDTVQFLPDGVTRRYIFEDGEVTMAFSINSFQFQSAQFYSGPAGKNLPTSPSSILRASALLLDAGAANAAYLAAIKQMLDIRLDSSDSSLQLRAIAQGYRDLDDNSGAFFIIEQVNDDFSFRDRFWKTVQRFAAV